MSSFTSTQIAGKRQASPRRVAGYVPIREYAAIGDGRTIALVARDGAIDWLCLPDIDSPSVFARLLDAKRGGYFSLAPDEPFDVERRYVPDTNVLETTYFTAHGVARVTDAMTFPDDSLPPFRELARRIEGLSGRMTLRWRIEPRFGYANWKTRLEKRGTIPVAVAHTDALAVCSWNAGDVEGDAGGYGGAFEIGEGDRALMAVVAAHQEPLVFPSREAVETRIETTIESWRCWTTECFTYQGRWKEAVHRSALALKLLIYAPSGAVAAAGTTSLPEVIGGERNWDYRFCWIRDAAFTLSALLRLGCGGEAHAFAWWFMHTTQLTHPYIGVLYHLDGGPHAHERILPLKGYRDSKPVRYGNAAVQQMQLDIYGDLFEAIWLYASAGYPIDREVGKRLAQVANLVVRLWQQPDSGIWEVRSAPAHFTHSKMMCWVALDRAIKLAESGHLHVRDTALWQRTATAIRTFIDTSCWSDSLQSYVRAAGQEELDASLLLMPLMGFTDGRSVRFQSTLDAIRQTLGPGPLIRRYRGEDGLRGSEGVFLTCSFWLVQALARSGCQDEAAQMMEELMKLGNDVGLFAEEIDTHTGEMLGNFPQGLVHLALIHAALELNPAE